MAVIPKLYNGFRLESETKIDGRYRPPQAFHIMLRSALRYAVESFISSTSLANIDRSHVDKIIDKAEASGRLMRLEHPRKTSFLPMNPIKYLSDKTIVGVDGGAYALKLYPLRVIVGKVAVFTHTQRYEHDFELRGIWRTQVAILKKSGNLEEQVKRKMRLMLVEVESRSVSELVEEYANNIDVVFWDGPLYTRRFLDLFLDTQRVLKEYYVPIVKLVKNPYSSRIAQFSDDNALTDADLMSVYLDSNQRTAMFLYTGTPYNKLPEEFKPVFFYVRTSKKHILRYEFPLWVLDEYGKYFLVRIIQADLSLGGGMSYVLSRADGLARFSEEERRQIFFSTLEILKKNGLDEVLLYNEFRWSRRSMGYA